MKKLLALLALASLGLAARATELAFIAHPGVTEGTLTVAEVKSILLGTKTTWSAGVIKLVVLANNPTHEHVIKTFTQRTPPQFDNHWKKLAFSGKGVLPEQAKDDAAVLAYVSTTPGAFGYVAQESVTDKVKVLACQ